VRVLVVNAGSSSLKLSVLDDERVEQTATVERWDGAGDLEPLRDFIGTAGGVEAVGHRVVHGGPRHRSAVRVDDEVVDYLDSIADLAPLHNPRAVAAIRAVGEVVPGVAAVAAFDTSFHATIPDAAATYALPRGWNHRFALRRYGFHGLSHAYAVRRAAELVGRPASSLRMVTCHLGAGASLCAVRDGRSVDTTMGFTPLAGLVMQTRAGSVDPGLMLWLLDHGEVEVETLSAVL
jgi:acetate kinase